MCHTVFRTFSNALHVLFLDGITGEELWSHYAAHEIFSINCNADITGDGVNDCIGGGRAGVRKFSR